MALEVKIVEGDCHGKTKFIPHIDAFTNWR